MEVRKGYKKTEVGAIPEDWKIAKLFYLINSNPDYGLNAPAIEYNINYPTYLRITDISEDGSFLQNTKKSVNRINSKHYYLEIGDIVIARTGASTGKSYLYKESDGKLVFAGFLIRIKPNISKLNPTLLKYTLQTSRYWKWVKSESMRSGQPGLNSNQISNLTIPLPPTLEEQKAIAEALNDADELIEALDKLIEKKEAIKKGAMQELLTGKKRLPGFAKSNEYKKTEVGVIPEGWEVKPIGEFSQSFSGGTPNTSNSSFYGSKIPFITSGELNQGRIRKTEKGITELGLNNSSAKLVYNGTLLIAMYGATAGVSAISEIIGSINQAILAIIPNDKTNNIFLFNWLTLNREAIISTYTQGGQPNLSGSLVKKVMIPLPQMREEQEAIAEVLSDMDEEIDKLKIKRDKTKLIKEGMMQELLTGKTRLV